MTMTTRELYGALSEIDELIQEYGDIFEALPELSIDKEGMTQLAIQRCGLIMKGIQWKIGRRLQEYANTNSEIDPTRYLINFDEKTLEFVLLMFVEGFVSYLLVQEANGYVWDEITAETLGKINEIPLSITNTGVTHPGIPSIPKAIVCLHDERTKKRFYEIRKFPKPVVIPNKDRSVLRLGGVIFSYAFLIAGELEYRQADDE